MGQVEEWLEGYDPSKITIATAASHSSLQIFHGARKEGFQTLGITAGNRDLRHYDAFPLGRPDSFLKLDSYKDLAKNAAELRKRNTILIPHGSLIEYLGTQLFEEIEVPVYGNREVLEWESNRDKERTWLEAAGITMPRQIKDPKDIVEPVIVKYHGAKGGRGFFIAKNYHEYKRRIQEGQPHTIQEFVLGTRYYLHYFHSRLDRGGFQIHPDAAVRFARGAGTATPPRPTKAAQTRATGKPGKGKAGASGDKREGATTVGPDGQETLGSLQMMSIDRRDESNIDEANRLGSLKDLEEIGIQPTFVVTGNIPMVIRESLLPQVFQMGERVIAESYPRFGGLWGPFCLETVVTPELEFKVFEISARIVAGTNPFIAGSPYTEFIEPGLSTGRRIARDILIGARQERLARILT